MLERAMHLVNRPSRRLILQIFSILSPPAGLWGKGRIFERITADFVLLVYRSQGFHGRCLGVSRGELFQGGVQIKKEVFNNVISITSADLPVAVVRGRWIRIFRD
jgi:hypothetical protein